MEDLEERMQEIELGNEKNCSVIGILDMDAFEVQIYLNDRHDANTARGIYLDTPCILVDSSTDRIISVNYEAKKFEISRSDTLPQALGKCPHLLHMRKDSTASSGKPEGTKLRHASWAVLDSIKDIREKHQLDLILEYATNDEFYLDLTQEVNYRMNNQAHFPVTLEELGSNTFLEGRAKSKGRSILFRAERVHKSNPPKYWQEARLVQGAMILEEIRRNIFTSTHFEASGGVACNKLMAKLACPLHKPGGVTILPDTGLPRIGQRIPIEKLPTLGGRLGEILKQHFKNDRMKMAHLADLPLWRIKKVPGILHEKAVQIYRLANGVSHDKVEEKLMKDTLSVGRSNLRAWKLFFNKMGDVRAVLAELFEELMERLKEEKGRHKRVTEGIRFDFHCYPKGHKGNPAVKGFTLITNSLRNPSKVNVNGILQDAMMEYRKLFIENEGAVNGMIVKMNLTVKNFIFIP